MKKILCLLICIFAFTNVYALDIKSKNVLFYNLNDNKLLLEQNKEEKLYMSDLDRIMIVYTAIDMLESLDKNVTITYSMLKDNNDNIGFAEGDIVSYKDLLYATLLTEALDAKNALVLSLAKSEAKYNEWMNNKVDILGLTNTHYDLTDSTRNYTSLEDTYKILEIALKNHTFKEIFETNKYTLSTGKTIQNKMYDYISNYPELSNLNTSILNKNGNSFISTKNDLENNIKYLLLTADTVENMIDDNMNIYDYYFKNYKYHIVVSKDEVVKTIIPKYSKDKIEVTLGEDVKYYTDNIDKSLLKIEYDGTDKVDSKTEVGSKLGTIHVKYNNENLLDYDVILDKKITFSLSKYLLSHIVVIITLLIAVIFVIFIIKRKA